MAPTFLAAARTGAERHTPPAWLDDKNYDWLSRLIFDQWHLMFCVWLLRDLKIQYSQCTNVDDSNDRIFHTHTPRSQRPPHDLLFHSFGFVFEFWVCFEHSTHTPQCSTPTPRFFGSEFWVCSRVLGLFRTFHTHTPQCSTPAPRYFPSKFWVCSWVLGLSRIFHAHTPWCFTPTPRIFDSEFWVCFEHSTHTHTHTMMLYAHPTTFWFPVLGLNLLDFNCRIV